MNSLILNDLKDTEKLAKKLAKKINKDFVLVLEGELAAGKTTFTSFLAKYLKIKESVNSPSFTILKQYKNKKITFNHFDFYRLEKIGLDFDLEEYLEEDINVLEWASNIKNFIPSERLEIKFLRLDENKRKLDIKAYGEKYKKILKCIV